MKKTITPQRQTRRSQVKAQAFDARPLVIGLTIFGFILALISLSTNASGFTAQEFKDIERKVWLGDSKSFPEVEKELVRVIQTTPSSTEAHYLLAHLYVRKYSESPSEMALLKKASDLGQQAMDLNPNSELGSIIIAEVLDMMGQTQNALKLLDPSFNPDIQFGWRKLFMEAKFKADKSTNLQLKTLLEQALQDPNSQWEIISPYIIAVIQSEATGNDLIAELSAWDSKYPTTTFKESLALALAKEGRYQEAHSMYVMIYSPKMDRIEPLLNDATLLYKHLNEPLKAKIILTHIVSRLSKNHSSNYAAIAELNLGKIFLDENNAGQAKTHFLNALMTSDSRFQILEQVTRSYRAKKDFAGLTSFIGEANIKLPGSGVLYALLGETLSEDIGNHTEAIEAFTNAIILEPNRTDYYNGMGLTYYRTNNLQKALLIFNQASKIDPEDAVSRYNVACVLAKLDRGQEALSSLREAISLDPKLIENAKADQDFQTIRNNEQFVEITTPKVLPVVEVKFAH